MKTTKLPMASGMGTQGLIKFLEGICPVAVLIASTTIAFSQQFQTITNSPVVSSGGSSLGAAWADLDEDGDLDIFVCNTANQNNFVFLNQGDGSFIKATSGALVSDGSNTDGVSIADFDNDGHLDVIVANYNEPSRYYRGLGNGNYVATNSAVGINVSAFGASAADFNNDGFLDLIIGAAGGNHVFLNSVTNGLVKVTGTSIGMNNVHSRGMAWADYDNDGDLDFYSAEDGASGQLFNNNGAGQFTKVATGDAVTTPARAFGAAWGDYDNDGDLDLFVSNLGGNQLLYRNDGGGTLTRITTGAVATTTTEGQDASWVDYDNDGYLDLFVASLDQNNLLFLNDRNGGFTRITSEPVTAGTASSVGAVWGDYDKNGFPDLFVANYNNQNDQLFRNNGNTNNWLAVNCKGIESNSSALGARLKVTATIHGKTVTQMREIHANGYMAHSSLTAHFGLGNAAIVNSLVIEWPSGETQAYDNVGVNHYMNLSEPTLAPLYFLPVATYFTNSTQVTIVNRLAPSITLYTLDGSEPTLASTLYTAPISLQQSATIKARAFFNGFPVSDVITGVYQRVYALEDGVPNSWREQYFGTNYLTDPRVAATADPDNDGYTNLQEYEGDTHPLDADSFPENKVSMLLNIDFQINASVSPKQGPAAIGVSASDFWNLSNPNSTLVPNTPRGTMTNLVQSDGKLSPVGFSVANAGGGWGNNSEDPMFFTYSYSRSTIRLKVTNLPPSTYSFYLYGHGLLDSENSVFEVLAGGTNYGQQATTTQSGWNTTNWQAGKQYVRYQGVTPSAAGEVEINVLPGVSGLAIVSGLQINREPDQGMQFYPAAQYFTNQLNVFILGDGSPGEIRYTLDNEPPTTNSLLYTGAITLTNGATIRAQTFAGLVATGDEVSARYDRVYALVDGVPNTWREQYFGTNYLIDPRVPATADPDNDGYTNLQEYVGGSNPLEADSVPIYSRIRAIPEVSWSSQTNKTYRISRRDSLLSTNWVQVGALFTATATNSVIFDPEATPVSFYRIELVP